MGNKNVERKDFMIDTDEEIKPYKPLPKGSKFAKANKIGQVPVNRITFSILKPHCAFIENNILIENECILLNGEICNRYNSP